MNEQWEDIEDYEGVYQVSNKGNVRNVKFDRPLSLIDHHTGYTKVNLYKNNKSRQYSVHRLVATAFIPNPGNKKFTNHKNGIKDDNRVENLEWCTASENMQHAFDNGLATSPAVKGEQQGNSKLKRNEVLQIRKMCKNGKSNTEIANIFGVEQHTICQIVYHKTWSHVGGFKKQKKDGAKFTEALNKDEVIEVRYIYENKPNCTQQELAERYNVSRSTIGRVLREETWQHI